MYLACEKYTDSYHWHHCNSDCMTLGKSFKFSVSKLHISKDEYLNYVSQKGLS